MHLSTLFLWPPAGSVHGPPLGLAAVIGYLRELRPDVDIQVRDLNVAVLTEALAALPQTSELHRTLRSRWTQADVVQDALSRWALGDDAPAGIGALPDWECHHLALLFGRTMDGFIASLEASPDLIGISVCDNGFVAAMGLTRRLRERFQDARIVWGGVSMSEEQADKVLDALPEVDAVVTGEGERALASLVDALPGLPGKTTPGVVTRKHRGWATRSGYLLAEPAFDLFDLSRYPALELPMSIGRGCAWGRCTFCNENYATSDYQAIDPIKGARHALEWQQRYRPVSFDLVDSAANSDRTSFRRFVDTLNEGGGLREWRCMMRTAGLRREDLEAAARSGLRTVYFGIESLDDSVLRAMNKGETVAQHLRAFTMALELGLRVEGDLILFYPADCPDAVRRSIEIVERYDHLFSRLDISFSRFVPGLGSATWREPAAFGIRLLPWSLRLARHLPPALSERLIAWDPMWVFDERPPAIVEELADSYLRLQAAIAEVRGRAPIARSWYRSGKTIVLETHGHADDALDRIFLEGEQRRLWMEPPPVSQEDNPVQRLMAQLEALGFVYRGPARWVPVAFDGVLAQALRNTAARPGPPEPATTSQNRLRID